VRCDNDIGDAVIIEIPRLSQTITELIAGCGAKYAEALSAGDAA
jgi:hypothetical protein